MNIDISDARQIYCNEILLEPKEGVARIYLTNVLQCAQRLPRGTVVGELEDVEPSQMYLYRVTDTTPLVPAERVAQLPTVKLDEGRRKKIRDAANLDHLPEILKDKYLKMLFENHECISLDEFDLGHCVAGAHSIPTKPNAPPPIPKAISPPN